MGEGCPAVVSRPFRTDHARTTLPLGSPHAPSRGDPDREQEVKRRARGPIPSSGGIQFPIRRYVCSGVQEDDGEPFVERYPRPLAELEKHFDESDRLTEVIREALGRVNYAE